MGENINMKENKDYTVGTYIKKKARKDKTGTICPICASCKNKRLCNNRRNTRKMLKCPECKECSDKENCDTFYISFEHKVTIPVGRDKETGKIIRKSFNGKSEAEAIYNSVQYQKAVESGEIVPEIKKDVHTIVSIVQDFENKKLRNGIISECTYHTNMFTLNRIKNESWANKPITDVSRKSIEDFLLSERANGMSNSILKKDYRLIRVAFDIALDKGYINSSQHHLQGRYGIMRPRSLKKDKKVRALTLDEQSKLITYLKSNKTKHNDLFMLALNTRCTCR